MNTTFDLVKNDKVIDGKNVKNERVIKSIYEQIEEPLSPTGLSSSSSSFTNNLIAQRFNIGADDPILNMYIGDAVAGDSKGSLVEDFFSHTPLH